MKKHLCLLELIICKTNILLFALVAFVNLLNAQTAYITNSVGNNVTLINVATNTVIAAIKVGPHPLDR